MKRFAMFASLALCVVALSCSKGSDGGQPNRPVVLQLNWLHDPTFAGEYAAASRAGRPLVLKEGGPNVFPLAELAGGRVDAAIVGADIFLEAVDKSSAAPLKCIFVDFQRNPVGWVLHPDAAKKAGMPPELLGKPKELNTWLFSKIAEGKIQVGDKRGTETTSVWIQWAKVHHTSDRVKVVPVGFDSAVILNAPMMIYPVYLNEEPFKLSEKIGRPVVVFDPAVDGVALYGNVVVVSDAFASDSKAVRELQERLRASWLGVRSDVPQSISLVKQLYTGVSSEVVQAQITKTLEFVFYETNLPGEMDTTGGRQWARTLSALQQAGLVSYNVNDSVVRMHLLPPE